MSDELQSKVDAKAEEASTYTEKLFGPGKGKKIEVDWSSFDKAEYSKEDAISYACNYEGYYSVGPIKDGCYYLSSYEDDEIVDVVGEGIEKIVVALEPGRDNDKKHYEFKDKVLTLYGVYENGSWSGVFEQSEVRSILMEAALSAKPDMKMEMLIAVCKNYWTRYGYFSSLRKLTENPDLFACPSEENLNGAKEVETEGTLIKLFDNMLKVNRHGRKQKRNLLITTSKFYTYEPKSGGKVDKENLQGHSYSESICIDIYPLSSGPSIGTTEYGFSIYTNEVKEKKPSFFSKFAGKLPGVKLPGIPLPGIPLPKMPGLPLPKVDLPSLPKIDLPSMPKIDLPDLPDVDITLWKRHKEPPPKRYHPATKDKRFFTFVVEKGETSLKNFIACEAAWIWFVGYTNATKNTEYPHYVPKKNAYEKGEEYEDKHKPKLKPAALPEAK